MSTPLIQLDRKKSAKKAVRQKTPAAVGKTTVGFVNLGCSKNQVDSELMLGTLVHDGFRLTGDAKKAEVVIINTCGFIEEAKQESINTILEHGKLKKKGACRVLIAAGCLAQRYQGDLLKELPELDGVVGTGEFGKIAEICRGLLAPSKRQQRLWISEPPYLYDADAPRLRLGKPHRAYVKIAEGWLAEQQAVVRVFYFQSPVCCLAIWVRYRLGDIEAESLYDRKVCLSEDAIVPVVAGKGLTDVMDCESHHDVEVRWPIYGIAMQPVPESSE